MIGVDPANPGAVEMTFCGRVGDILPVGLTVTLNCPVPIFGNGVLVEKEWESPLDLEEVRVRAQGAYFANCKLKLL